MRSEGVYAGFALVVSALLFGCGAGGRTTAGTSAEETLRVIVSIPPQETFVSRIGGDRVSVVSLVAPGQDAHSFEPTPAQMAAFTEAQLFLGIGFPFEERIAAKIADTNRRLVRVDTSATVPKRLMTEEHRHEDSGHEHEDSDEEHGEADPHVWLSPEAVRIQAAAIRDALKAADPAGAERYESNYLAFARELEDLDREIASILSGMEGKTVYVYHPVLGYFTDRYRLIQRAIEVEGKEPTARQLADFIDRLRAERVGMIFVQKEFSTRSAEAVAAETGAVVKTIDPLSRDWFQEMRRIAHDISGK